MSKMRVAVISDIHGNRQAFEAVLEEVRASQCQELWCLGDVIGYGADPDACIDLVCDNASLCLAGNHDLGILGRLPLEQFSQGAALAARWTQSHTTRENLDRLRDLEPQNTEEAVGLYHASPRDPVWEYVLSPLQADLCMDVDPHRISLVGHSHVALSFSRMPGAAATGQTRTDGTLLLLTAGEWILNPGSVGQPRDGDPRAAWMELDLDELQAEFHRVEYDIDGAAEAIRAARLPDSLAERLFRGL